VNEPRPNFSHALPTTDPQFGDELLQLVAHLVMRLRLVVGENPAIGGERLERQKQRRFTRALLVV